MAQSPPLCLALYSPAYLSVELVFSSHLLHIARSHIDNVCHSQPQRETVQNVRTRLGDLGSEDKG